MKLTLIILSVFFLVIGSALSVFYFGLTKKQQESAMFSFEISYRLSDVFSSAISVESTQKNSEIESLWVDKYKAIK